MKFYNLRSYLHSEIKINILSVTNNTHITKYGYKIIRNFIQMKHKINLYTNIRMLIQIYDELTINSQNLFNNFNISLIEKNFINSGIVNILYNV